MGFREDVKKIKALTDERTALRSCLLSSMGRSADVSYWKN